jgi:hypothetical protein
MFRNGVETPRWGVFALERREGLALTKSRRTPPASARNVGTFAPVVGPSMNGVGYALSF